MSASLLDQARQLSLEGQLELVEALWDSITERGDAPPLTETQRTELDRRLADPEAHPGDVVAWSDVKTAALVRISSFA